MPPKSRRWCWPASARPRAIGSAASWRSCSAAALRIAYHYLRDAADADEAVQDAFVKVFLHIEQYREDLSFDGWFMRILVNACLDRLKSRSRQQRWIASPLDDAQDERPVEQAAGTAPSTEHGIAGAGTVATGAQGRGDLAGPAAAGVHAVASRRADRAEISEATGMSPATVRVHLFRAIRKLRAYVGRTHEQAEYSTSRRTG